MGRFAAGRPPSRKTGDFSGVPVDQYERNIREADNPVTVFALADADSLADQCFGDVAHRAAPLDLTTAADPAYLLVGAVLRILDPLGEWSRRRAVELLGRPLAERFVWAVVVELPAKCIEAILLLRRRCRRWNAGLGLQCPMHAFVPAILLRLAGIDTLQPYAHLDPAHR